MSPRRRRSPWSGAKAAHDAGPPALEVSNLSYGHALTDVSFKVARGEVLGVAALEGQGQEELFDCIAGVRRADAGVIKAEGVALGSGTPLTLSAQGWCWFPPTA